MKKGVIPHSLPRRAPFNSEGQRSVFNRGLPRSIMHSIQPKADLTGVAPADGAGVNNGPRIIREIF